MDKQMLAIFVLACLMATPSLANQDQYECRERAKKLCGPSTLTFYLHNTLYDASLNNTDTFNSVAGAPPSMITAPFFFGTMVTFEDPLTQGPSTDSPPLGSAQGFYLFDSLKEHVLFHVFTANITQGSYTGSITIMGQVRETSPIRYLSVVGGTGDFLGAHGLATNTLVSFSLGPPVHWTNSYVLDLYY